MYSLKIKRKALKAAGRLPEGAKRRVEETLKVLQTKPIPAMKEYPSPNELDPMHVRRV